MIMTAQNSDIEQFEENLNAFQRYLSTLPEKALGLGIRVLIAAIVFLIGVKLIKLIRKIVKKSLLKANAETGVMQFMDGVIKVALYIILVLMIAGNFGFDAASIVALLGSAGMTIGLALQGSLSNFAGGVLLMVLKPFHVGDYIVDASGHEGTVKEISIFYTKLMTVDQKIVMLPNGTLANGSIINASEANYRKLDLRFGISYDADIKQAKQVVERIIRENELIDTTQPIQVFVDALAASEVTIGARCLCKTSAYWDAKWKITEDVKYAFDEAKIEIPYQQISIHMSEK